MASSAGSDPKARWQAAYGEVPPLGYELRNALPDLWTRFHALRGSKQYAESPEERAIILERANELADRCLQSSSQTWLIRETGTHWNRFDDPEVPLNWRPFLDWSDVSDPEEEVSWSFECAKVDWIRGKFDRLFAAIADEEARALFFSQSNGLVFAPYDGGFDLILPTREDVVAFEDDYRSWMGYLPRGL